MLIEGLEWMDWLHKKREESYEDRKKNNISIAEYLDKIAIENEPVVKKMGIKTIERTKK